MTSEDEENEEITHLIDDDSLLNDRDFLRQLAIEDEVITNCHRVLIVLRFLGVIGDERLTWRGRRRRRPRANTHLAREYAS